MNSDSCIIADAHIFFKLLHTDYMKKFICLILCFAAATAAVCFTGCTEGGNDMHTDGVKVKSLLPCKLDDKN